MKTIAGSEIMLNKEPKELGRLLLEAARQDGAPRAARERALLSVTTVALSMGVASSALGYASQTSFAKASGWLAAKWLILGLGSGVVTIAVAQEVQQVIMNQARTASPTAAVSAKNATRVFPANAVRERPMLDHQPDVPAASPTAVIGAGQSAFVRPLGSFPPGYGVAPVAQSATESGGPAAPASKDTITPLTRELSLLEQARGALAQHSAPRALQALDDYRSQFPSGSLQAEAAALRVEAVGQSGDRALAERLAASFLVNYSTSPLAGRVRALADTFHTSAQKP
jgi:hypothetical protein